MWVKYFVLMLMILLSGAVSAECSDIKVKEKPISIAVEFTDHASCAYVALHKGWYKENGVNISVYESYITGASLGSALARGGIQVAYMCLVPAINAYANAEVPIKLIAGTHKYGYSLVVDPKSVKNVQDLQNSAIRIGCVREGGSVDVLLNRMVQQYELDREKVLENLQRMNPPMQVIGVRTGKLDAAFVPEHHATMAESYGMEVLLESSKVWPKFQGSVLAVRKTLIDNRPEVVQKLVNVTRKATGWTKKNKHKAANIVAEELKSAKGKHFPSKIGKAVNKEEISSQLIYRSMWEGNRMMYTTSLNPAEVQDIVNYMAKLGYIKRSFCAEKFLDLSFLEQ